MVIARFSLSFYEGYLIALTLDELCNWTAFSILFYLLCASAPAWIKEYFSKSKPLTP